MGTSRHNQFAMVLSATSQPVSLTCSFNAASKFAFGEVLLKRMIRALMSWTHSVSL